MQDNHSIGLKGSHPSASIVTIQDAIIFLEDDKYVPKDAAMTQKCLSEVGQRYTFLVIASGGRQSVFANCL